MHTEQIQGKTDLEWVHEIGNHVAVGNTFDEALAATVSFAVALVNCDFCFIYVRDGAELLLWAWQHLDQEEKYTKLPLAQGHAALLAQHRVPIAIATDGTERSETRIFDQWSDDPGETFVSVPLLSRKELVGVINLRHRQPRRYSLREVKLLSAIGRLLGTGIGITRMENQNSDLLSKLETRKLVERGKGILQRDHGLSEEQAYLALQRYSREKRKSMKEIAQAIILGDECKRNALNDAAPVLRRSSPGNAAMLEVAESSSCASATE
jgi:uroporphyrinogen-III synthase